MTSPTSEYWDSVASEWQYPGYDRTWRMVHDAINVELLQQWLQPNSAGSVLKTDLFDEVVGEGLVPWLSTSFRHVDGIDISPLLIKLVQPRLPQLRARSADVRSLPFPDATYDVVVSNSTLDHFASAADIPVALAELHRVLRPGGSLVVTMDNLFNPVVMIRNALPSRLRDMSGAAPFAVGPTCGPGGLRSYLKGAGFEVEHMRGVFHSPRLLVVLAGDLLDRRASESTKQRWVRFWRRFELLGRLPTRYFTGHFVAALARKP